MSSTGDKPAKMTVGVLYVGLYKDQPGCSPLKLVYIGYHTVFRCLGVGGGLLSYMMGRISSASKIKLVSPQILQNQNGRTHYL